MGLIDVLYDELEMTLDEKLERAKKNPFKVRLDYKYRFRVWHDQVIVDRLMQLRKSPLLETAIRYEELTLRDYARLYKRATKEFLKVMDKVANTEKELKTSKELYELRQIELKDVHNEFLDEVLDIINRR